MYELFRPEAVAASRRPLEGEILLATPLPFRVLCGVAVATVGLGLVFASNAHFSRQETVSGWLRPKGGLLRVVAPQGGVVERILVDENSLVRSGQPLAELRLSPEGMEGDVGLALSRKLVEQSSAQKEQAVAAAQSLGAQSDTLRLNAVALERQVAETRRRIELLEQRLKIARAEVDRAKDIARRGYMSQRELQARVSTALEAEDDLSSVRSEAFSLERELGDVRGRVTALEAQRRASSAEAASANVALDQLKIRNDAETSLVSTAPIAGRVAVLPIVRGQSLPANGVVAVLVPAGSHLEVELFAPSRAAGFIRPGQAIRFMYDAFPYQKFGVGEGRVIDVSVAALRPEDVVAPGVSISEPVYRVRASLPRQYMRAYGESQPLRAGMTLKANIVVDRRTLGEWLFDPLYAAGRR